MYSLCSSIGQKGWSDPLCMANITAVSHSVAVSFIFRTPSSKEPGRPVRGLGAKTLLYIVSISCSVAIKCPAVSHCGSPSSPPPASSSPITQHFASREEDEWRKGASVCWCAWEGWECVQECDRDRQEVKPPIDASQSVPSIHHSRPFSRILCSFIFLPQNRGHDKDEAAWSAWLSVTSKEKFPGGGALAVHMHTGSTVNAQIFEFSPCVLHEAGVFTEYANFETVLL